MEGRTSPRAASVAASLGHEQTKIIGSSNMAMLNFALGLVDETMIMLGLKDATQGFKKRMQPMLRALLAIVKWRKMQALYLRTTTQAHQFPSKSSGFWNTKPAGLCMSRLLS